MNQYMAEVTLPAYLTQDFMDIIPQQRSFVNDMFERGIITGYSLAEDRSKLWVTFLLPTQEEVAQVIRKFPISEYISYRIHELAFHDSISVMVPSISLN